MPQLESPRFEKLKPTFDTITEDKDGTITIQNFKIVNTKTKTKREKKSDVLIKTEAEESKHSSGSPSRVGYLNLYEKSLQNKLKSKLSFSGRDKRLNFKATSKERKSMLDTYLDEPMEYQSFKFKNSRTNSIPEFDV